MKKDTLLKVSSARRGYLFQQPGIGYTMGMQNTRRKLLFMLVILLILLSFTLSGCDAEDTVIGYWQEPVSGVTMNIGKDDMVILGYNGASFNLPYELQEPDVLVFKASEDGSIPEQKMIYVLAEDTLTITLDGVDTIFYRMKEEK